jgi:cytochrome P450/NADPH-cytochrome P450 reductase
MYGLGNVSWISTVTEIPAPDQPTDDAGYFVEYIKTAKADVLSGVKYAVFGCGHPDWASTFMAIPDYIDNRFAELGGQRLCDRGQGDASKADLFEEFEAWEDGLWHKLQSSYTNVAAPDADAKNHERLQAEIDSTHRQNLLRYDFLQSVKVISNEIISKGDIQMKRQLVLELPAEASYRAGDYLGLLPTTPLPVVMRALVRLNLHVDDMITLKGTSGGGTLPIGTAISALSLFSEFFELEQPATIKQIRSLAERSTDDSSKTALDRYAQAEVYDIEISAKRVTVLALLEEFPQLPISVSEYIEMLPSIKMRQVNTSVFIRLERRLTLSCHSIPSLLPLSTYLTVYH